jgi:hypothetical protein
MLLVIFILRIMLQLFLCLKFQNNEDVFLNNIHMLGDIRCSFLFKIGEKEEATRKHDRLFYIS